MNSLRVLHNCTFAVEYQQYSGYNPKLSRTSAPLRAIVRLVISSSNSAGDNDVLLFPRLTHLDSKIARGLSTTNVLHKSDLHYRMGLSLNYDWPHCDPARTRPITVGVHRRNDHPHLRGECPGTDALRTSRPTRTRSQRHRRAATVSRAANPTRAAGDRDCCASGGPLSPGCSATTGRLSWVRS